MSTHFILQCSCGALIAQCRCPEPAKRVEVRPCGCPHCAAIDAARRQAQAPQVATYEDSRKAEA
jgi:hypothetical protein